MLPYLLPLLYKSGTEAPACPSPLSSSSRRRLPAPSPLRSPSSSEVFLNPKQSTSGRKLQARARVLCSSREVVLRGNGITTLPSPSLVKTPWSEGGPGGRAVEFFRRRALQHASVDRQVQRASSTSSLPSTTASPSVSHPFPLLPSSAWRTRPLHAALSSSGNSQRRRRCAVPGRRRSQFRN